MKFVDDRFADLLLQRAFELVFHHSDSADELSDDRDGGVQLLDLISGSL